MAELIWKKVHGTSKPFRYECEEGFTFDVQKRIPDVDKAKKLLGFEATTSLDEMLDEVIPWVKEAISSGLIWKSNLAYQVLGQH